MKKIYLGIVVLIILLIIFYFFHNTKSIYRTISIKAGEQIILVEVSDTSILRTRGLSGRKSLKEGRGMLFVFDKLAKYGFWMKDMNFPIDIVWIDGLKQVIGAESNISPESYPKIYLPKAPVLYVLELPANTYQKQPFTEISF